MLCCQAPSGERRLGVLQMSIEQCISPTKQSSPREKQGPIWIYLSIMEGGWGSKIRMAMICCLLRDQRRFSKPGRNSPKAGHATTVECRMRNSPEGLVYNGHATKMRLLVQNVSSPTASSLPRLTIARVLGMTWRPAHLIQRKSTRRSTQPVERFSKLAISLCHLKNRTTIILSACLQVVVLCISTRGQRQVVLLCNRAVHHPRLRYLQKTPVRMVSKTEKKCSLSPYEARFSYQYALVALNLVRHLSHSILATSTLQTAKPDLQTN